MDIVLHLHTCIRSLFIKRIGASKKGEIGTMSRSHQLEQIAYNFNRQFQYDTKKMCELKANTGKNHTICFIKNSCEVIYRPQNEFRIQIRLFINIFINDVQTG